MDTSRRAVHGMKKGAPCPVPGRTRFPAQGAPHDTGLLAALVGDQRISTPASSPVVSVGTATSPRSEPAGNRRCAGRMRTV
ncbi:hypothetical protein SPRI_2440 [Streptomyces pristinaespiralis]|uniref:Uncharacterized protein n=1 Tax=Streptomyces pristinaespiralis TaxID=38300 RepID=A0A0M4D8Z7_STRPR|nr:hypothetical protein SPRI_2440 [Streptomyces pristinaespiralis]